MLINLVLGGALVLGGVFVGLMGLESGDPVNYVIAAGAIVCGLWVATPTRPRK